MTPQERLVVLIDIITTKAIEFQNFGGHCHHLPGTDHWPPSVRFAVIRAEEVGKDVNEEDLLASYRVDEIMDLKAPVLKRDATLKQVLQTAAESEFLYYPVVDEASHPIGIISFLEIKQMFMTGGLESLVLACDLMTEILAVTVPEANLIEALEKMKEVKVEVLPVVSADKDRRLVGMIEQGRIRQVISREIFRKEDITIFDQLYNEFWFGKDRANRMLSASQLNRAISLW